MTFALHLRHVFVSDSSSDAEGWIDSRADLDGRVAMITDEGERLSFNGWMAETIEDC